MEFKWDPDKARTNYHDHGVRFQEGIPAIEDDGNAITFPDDVSDDLEQRWITLGMGAMGRVLVVVYTYRGVDTIRIISARKATRHELQQYGEIK